MLMVAIMIEFVGLLVEKKVKKKRGSKSYCSSTYVAGRHSHRFMECTWCLSRSGSFHTSTHTKSMEQERITKDDNALS